MLRLLPLATLGLGLGGGYLWPRPLPEPLPEPLRVARAQAACDLGDMAETLSALRTERAEKQQRYASVQQALVEVIGAPEPWPEVTEDFAEDAVLGLPELLGEDFDVVSVDCTEYPCVALVEMRGDTLQARLDAQQGLRDRLAEHGYVASHAAMGLHPEGEEQEDWRVSATFSLPDPEVPEDDERSAFRIREASEFLE
ncbi:MAG: hypothetical protein EP330_11570 [Deltaproteobacteria bacterium]|nr:MAG: hypothetical protein EP330_11570 [Deltaproteobacteria bacterium]